MRSALEARTHNQTLVLSQSVVNRTPDAMPPGTGWIHNTSIQPKKCRIPAEIYKINATDALIFILHGSVQTRLCCSKSIM